MHVIRHADVAFEGFLVTMPADALYLLVALTTEMRFSDEAGTKAVGGKLLYSEVGAL